MPVGPVEVVVVKFPGSKFNGEIAPALVDAVEKGDVRILDLVFLSRPDDDEAVFVEIDDLDDELLAPLGDNLGSLVGLLNDEDLGYVAADLEVGSSAVAIVFEHAWAARLASAVRGSHGELILDERIPADVVAASLAAVKNG